MAERQAKWRKLGYKTDSEKKRHLQDRKRKDGRTRVYLGRCKGAWDAHKSDGGFLTDAHFARALLSCYSKRTKLSDASTPRSRHATGHALIPPTPGLSAISHSGTETALDAGSTTDTATGMSGVEELSLTLPSTVAGFQQPYVSSFEDDDSEDPLGLDEAARLEESYRPFHDHLYTSDSEDDSQYSDDNQSESSNCSLERTGIDVEVHQLVDDTDDDDEAMEEDQEEDESDNDSNALYTSTSGIQMVTSASDMVQEKCSIAYLSSLELLAAHAPRNMACDLCAKPLVLRSKQKGTAMYLTWACDAGHIRYKWASQPRLKKRGVPAGDFLLCANTIVSGNNFTKVSLLLRYMNIGIPQPRLHHSIEAFYVCPGVDSFWQEKRRDVLKTLKDSNKDIIIAGDGRNDSPGYSSQYMTYTLMEHDTKDILHMSFVDKRQVALKSPNMEVYGMKKAMQHLLTGGMVIKEFVSDAHPTCTSIMKKEYPDIIHNWDIWHAAKNLGKKLNGAASLKNNSELAPWVADIKNHFWYCSQNCGGSVDKFVNMWRGMLHHVLDQHSWALGKCDHEELDVDGRTKPWLQENSSAFHALTDIIMDKTFLGNASYIVNFRHTGTLESFHNHLLMYASKRFAFSYPGYVARNQLAALDYQAHKDRPQATKKNGEAKYSRTFNKRSKQWAPVPVKVAKTYTYIPTLQTRIAQLCLDDKLPLRRKVTQSANDPRRLKGTIAPLTPPPTKDLVARMKSRFGGDESSDSDTVLYNDSDTIIYYNSD